jgi:hypothetical protein
MTTIKIAERIFIEPVRTSSNKLAKALGKPETITPKIIMEIPLIQPLSHLLIKLPYPKIQSMKDTPLLVGLRMNP